MATPVNPKTLTWVDPTTATGPGGATVAWSPADMAGIEIQIDGTPAVSVPTAAAATSFDLTTLAAYTGLAAGSHTLALAVTTKEGITGAFAAPITFLAALVPVAPTNVVVA